jgi:hypothetical protein
MRHRSDDAGQLLVAAHTPLALGACRTALSVLLPGKRRRFRRLPFSPDTFSLQAQSFPRPIRREIHVDAQCLVILPIMPPDC